MRSKGKAERRHAQRRLIERYGVHASNADMDRYVGAIQSGRARFIRRQSLRVTVWDVEHEGRLLRLVYDKHRKQIITALPVVREDA